MVFIVNDYRLFIVQIESFFFLNNENYKWVLINSVYMEIVSNLDIVFIQI